MKLDRRRLGIAGAGFTTFVNLYATQSILAVLASGLGVDRPHTALTITAPLLAVAMIAPFVGTISDRRGRRSVIVTASWLLVLPTFLCAAAPNLAVLVGLRFLQGLLMPFIFAVTVAYVGDEFQGGEAIKMTGVYAVGTILGGFLGRLIAGHVAAWGSWRVAFVGLGVATVLGAASTTMMLPREQRFRPSGSLSAALRGIGQHLRNPTLVATYVVGFAVLFSIVASFTFVNLLLAAPPYALGPAALGNMFVIYLLGALVTPVATRVAIRLGKRATLLLATAVAMVGLLATLLAPLAAIMAGLSLVVCGMFFEQTLSMAYVGITARTARSTAVGLYVSCYYLGGSVGGILPAVVWQWGGWPGCVGLIMAVQTLMLAIALYFWRE